MRRRQFITLLGGAAVAARALTLPAQAQPTKLARIGILNFENPEPFRTLLREGLREIGYEEGRNLQIEYRPAEGQRDRLPRLAADLVRLNVDLIVAYPTPAVVAIRRATSDIPIVLFGAGDPVGTGLVSSLARPGGNITGTSSTTAELGAKTLEVIRDILPSTRRVAVLANATDAFTPSFLEQMELGGRTLKLEIQTFMIKEAEELESAFAAMKSNAADAVVVQPSLPRIRVADLALKHRVPSIAPTAAYAGLGGLAAYAANPLEMARRTAGIIDKILKDSKPADIPVEQPTKFDLVINLKTAKALGLAIPPTLLALADEVIE
jgi:putative tryptophan/tyrosine transport system substrate-binding protein